MGERKRAREMHSRCAILTLFPLAGERRKACTPSTLGLIHTRTTERTYDRIARARARSSSGSTAIARNPCYFPAGFGE